MKAQEKVKQATNIIIDLIVKQCEKEGFEYETEELKEYVINEIEKKHNVLALLKLSDPQTHFENSFKEHWAQKRKTMWSDEVGYVAVKMSEVSL